MRHWLPCLGLIGLVACGGSSDGGGNPTGPTPPPPTTFTLSGRVTDASNGQGVSGATVQILDGPASGRSATTDGAGNYSIGTIAQSGFTVRARAQYFTERSEGVSLTADRTQNFSLAPIPLFSFSGSRNSVFDMPTHVRLVRIFGRWNGRGTSNFIVRIGGFGVVNAILRDGNPYEGVHSTAGGVVEVRNSENITQWSFTEVR